MNSICGLHTFYLKGYAPCRRPLLAPRGCHLGGLGASILAPWQTILAPREPWELQDGHEGLGNRTLIGFGLVLGPYLDSFTGTEA